MTKLYSSSREGEGGLRDTSTSGSSPPQRLDPNLPRCWGGLLPVASVPQNPHLPYYTQALFTRRGGGYPTCLVNALLGITRLPGTTFLRHACPVIMTVTSRLLERNYQIFELKYNRLNNIRYFLYTMIIFSHFFVNLTSFQQRTSSFISNLGRYKECHA